MRKYLMQNIPIVVFLVLNLIPSYAQDRNSTATTPVQMMVTLRVQGKDKRTPEVRRDDIIVRQGKERLQVTGWTPLGDVQSGVDLFFLIDHAAHSSLALQFDTAELHPLVARKYHGRSWIYAPRNRSDHTGPHERPRARGQGVAASSRFEWRLRQPLPVGDRPDEALARTLELARDRHDHGWNRAVAGWPAASWTCFEQSRR